MKTMITTNRLETIAKRHRKARKLDLLFVLVVAFAAMTGATVVHAAAHGVAPDQTAQL